MPVPLNIKNTDNLPVLNLPQIQFKFREDEFGYIEIFDSFRKKFIKLTPEEWVRQNFAMYLVMFKGYPQSRIKLEKTIKIGKSNKRCDIVYFDKELNPEIIVECKSVEINLSQSTFAQASMYNSQLKVKYLMITNGLEHYIIQPDYENKEFKFLNFIPDYQK